MHTCFQAAFQEWARTKNTSRFGGLEYRNVLLHPSLTVWGLRKGLLCNTTQTTSLGVQNQDGEWYGLASGVHTGQDQGHRMSRLHSVGRILLETQAPITNTQWLSAVEHVKARAQQMRIKALPPRTPAEPHEECKEAPLQEVRTR